MKIPKPLIAMANVVLVMERTDVDGKPARRASSSSEIKPCEAKGGEILTEEVFRWNPKFDRFSSMGASPFLERFMKKTGLTEDDVKRELQVRKAVLDWLVQQNIRRHGEVAKIIREYYANPNRVIQKARMGLK
jgi:flagellar protein FlaI